MKRLRANPWAELAAKYKVDDIVEAPVLRVSQFGVFLALDGGISGLIHLSEVAGDVSELKAGDPCKAKIITFDAQAKRIGLSMKALDPNYTGPTAEIVAETGEVAKPAKKPAAKKVKTEEVVAETPAPAEAAVETPAAE